MKIDFKGKFQWWTYTVGHGQLLLRRVKNSQFNTRIDVLFKNVAAVQLAAVLSDIAIEDVDSVSIPNLARHLGDLGLSDRKVYRVRGQNFEGYVVAGTVSWHEDDEDYDKPSKLL